MAQIKLITVTGLTASDGSYIASGATIKFQTNIEIDGTVRIYPKIYRDDIAYVSGYTSIYMRPDDFPDDVILIILDDNGLYNFTSQQLYTKAKNTLNTILGSIVVDIETII